MDIEDPEQLSIRIETSKISSWNTDGRPAGVRGQIGFNSQTLKIEVYDGAVWKTYSPDP